MGIAFQNLGTTPNNSTFTSDVGSATKLLSSGQFANYLQQEIYEQSAMVRSGLLATDARLNNIQGVIAEMPFAAPLNYNEEQVNSSSTWGDQGAGIYTIQKTQASTQYAPIVTRGAAFGMDDLSLVQTGFDALANIRSQLATDMNRKITAKILAQLEGLFKGALLEHKHDAAGELTASDIIKGKALLGERGQEMDILIVHPDVRFHLENLGMTVIEAPAGGGVATASFGVGLTSTEIGYFAGLRVISDSQVPKAADGTYTCYLAKSGVIRTGAQFPLLIETERNKLSLQDSMIVTYNRCDHVVGTSWVAGAYSSDPTNDDLKVADNWIAAFSDTRLIPLVQITCKSSFESIDAGTWEKHPSVVTKGDKTKKPTRISASGTDDDGGPGTELAAPPQQP